MNRNLEMNQASKKLNSTVTNWRAWCKDLGLDLDKIDNMDDESLSKVEQQVDKIKRMLEQCGFDSAYIRGLPRNLS